MRISGLTRIGLSARTRFGILTSGILLSLLLVFYLGGRHIMINLIREAEKEIGSVSVDIKNLMLTQISALRQFNTQSAILYADKTGGERTSFIKSLIQSGDPSGVPADLSLLLREDGTLLDGYCHAEGGKVKAVEPAMLEPYFSEKKSLARFVQNDRGPVTGIIVFEEKPYYISLTRVENTADGSPVYLCNGAVVQNTVFFRKMAELSQGLSVNLNECKSLAAEKAIEASSVSTFASIFEDKLFFSADKSWNIGSRDLEAVIPIHDITGREVSSISIRFPRSFASLTKTGLAYLTVFVAAVGIFFIIPIFWLQGRILLNPLSRLEKKILHAADNLKKGKIEYLNNTRNNEFGRVARSVNSLLRELDSKSQQVVAGAERQKALIEGIPDCLCLFNKDRCLVSVEKHPDNVPPIPGLEPNRLISPDHFKSDSVHEFDIMVDKVFRYGGVKSLTMISLDANKLLRYFETRITRINDQLALVVFRDITSDVAMRKKQELIEARDGKVQQMNSLGNMAAGIAHDFNNILTIIKNTLAAQASPASRNTQLDANAATVINEAANRGRALVQELMTYAGQANINLYRRNPSEIVAELTPLYKGVITPNVNLEIAHGENLHDVMVDPHQFWKVIINLVKNGAESIKSSHGYIKISTYNYELTTVNNMKFFSTHPLETGQGVVFEVSDNGEGIPQRIIERLFEPFFSTKSVGRGLGLATVFGIVDSHNGGISIFSRENVGTKFRVWLPAAEEESDFSEVEELLPPMDEDEAATDVSSTFTRQGSSARSCVLIIDDDPSIVKTTALLVEAMGIDALTAKSKTEALARYRKYKNRINLIMMDAEIGNLDSVRLLATLRMNRKNLPVVICSGHTREKITKMFETHKIDGILAKPYSMVDLREMLARFISITDS